MPDQPEVQFVKVPAPMFNALMQQVNLTKGMLAQAQSNIGQLEAALNDCGNAALREAQERSVKANDGEAAADAPAPKAGNRRQRRAARTKGD